VSDLADRGGLRAWAAVAALYAACFAAATAPLWTRQAFPRWDALDMLYPAFAVLSDGLRSGRYPLWDPYTNCGYPLYADAAVSAGLNPVAVLLALVVPRPSLGFVLYWLAHWAWGGLGMMALARRHGAAPLGGLVAACSYAFSGYFVGHGQHTPFVVTAAWLPWCFALADGAVEGRRAGRALLAGVALGASALAGYPALSAFAGVALALWLALRWLTPLGEGPATGPELRARAAWVAGTLAACALLLVLIWSPALVAFFREGAAYTERTGALPREIANHDNVFPLRALSSLWFPLPTVAAAAWFAEGVRTDVSMTNGYVGILALPLAATWVLGRAPRRRWWIVPFAAFALALSFGGPFRAVVYELLPVARYMRHNAAFRLFWMIAVALAAGCGASDVCRDAVARRRFAWLLAAWALAAGAGAIFLGSALLGPAGATELGAVRVFAPAALVVAASGGALLVVRRSPRAWTPGALGAVLALLFAADGAWHLHQNQATVWERNAFIDQVEATPKWPIALTAREPDPLVPGWPWSFNAQQVLRIPVAGGYVTMKSTGFNDVLLKARFKEVLLRHRFWVAPGRLPMPPEEVALQALAATGGDDPVPVFVAGDAGPEGAPAVAGTYGSASVSQWSPERIVLRVSAPNGGILVSTERYAAGWTATLDGRPARVQRVNLYFVGVTLPPGEHDVVLAYRAGPLWPLVGLSAASAVGAVIAGVLLERRARAARLPPA
jgi:hypothetical protein